MNRHGITRRRLLAGAAATVAAAYVPRTALAATPDTLRIAVATAGGGDPITWGGSPGSVARLNGWVEDTFKNTGTRIEWLFFKGAGPAVNEAISNKQIDFAYHGDLPSTVGRSNGLKTRILLISGARNNLYVVTPPDSSINSIEALKDKRVSIFRGTNGHLVAVNLLAAHGLSERDIKGINLDSGSAQAALASRGIDASFGGSEFFKLRDQGLARVAFSTQGGDPSFTRQAHLHVRDEFASQYPEAVQRIVDVFVRAADWASDEKNRDELFKLWARSGTPYQSYVAEFEGQDLAVRNSPLIDEFIIGRYQAVVSDALKLKLIRREVSVDDWFDPSFLRQSLKSQGLESRWTYFDASGKAPGDPPAIVGS
ncbi:ABC transporter substrate-binding protein [Bordetella sp. BOR01]|uniref:ABC transporter substrate-binding protein n=1 Tax=Bordetella sp. BOR01 TaxID=2854779 RepID=UPI001C471822|nr:ABC transporter substrate-binding protein [Bordetella sp. BOR01]MBV7482939.1 ABC transporter substrate-binding protein [Bordetella sp. BOR01]